MDEFATLKPSSCQRRNDASYQLKDYVPYKVSSGAEDYTRPMFSVYDPRGCLWKRTLEGWTSMESTSWFDLNFPGPVFDETHESEWNPTCPSSLECNAYVIGTCKKPS